MRLGIDPEKEELSDQVYTSRDRFVQAVLPLSNLQQMAAAITRVMPTGTIPRNTKAKRVQQLLEFALSE